MPTEPLTGTPYPAASAAPNVPQDIQNAVAGLADNTFAGPFASTTTRDAAFAAWVAAGNTMRNYLHCTVTGVGEQVYLSGAWRNTTVAVTGGRLWTFARSGNAQDTFASGSFVVVQSDTISGAPAGTFQVISRMVISNTTPGAGFQRTLANGSPAVVSDARADTGTTARHVFVQAGGILHTGGNLTINQYYNASTGSPTVYSQGTETCISYLGP